MPVLTPETIVDALPVQLPMVISVAGVLARFPSSVVFTLPWRMIAAVPEIVHFAPGSSAATISTVGATRRVRFLAAAIATALPTDETPALFVAAWDSFVRLRYRGT